MYLASARIHPVPLNHQRLVSLHLSITCIHSRRPTFDPRPRVRYHAPHLFQTPTIYPYLLRIPMK